MVRSEKGDLLKRDKASNNAHGKAPHVLRSPMFDGSRKKLYYRERVCCLNGFNEKGKKDAESSVGLCDGLCEAGQK